MKYKWLQKNNNKSLIVFFNGWGMDENAVKHLDCENFDVIVFYDYNSLVPDDNPDLAGFEKKHIIGWSMGVMVLGTNPCDFITKNADSITAIAGTPKPINDEYGIPEKIYNMTIRGFSENSAKRFIERMGLSIGFDITNRDFESQKNELIKLTEYKSDKIIDFSKVIVPQKDLIIPTKNQIRYWEEHNTKYTFTPGGHYPFLSYNKWSELI